ncbi:hypothetical protein INT43_006472 [Umbelopsis isabellina]|uniref:Uncharacterized protein n=1 Tax=Mortierella isabellina TaxID=91625 RepID=A0A8H7Q2G6_MORIS|nr:hypothetical protein INT43_006472 [Umbelopsis isabellina]
MSLSRIAAGDPTVDLDGTESYLKHYVNEDTSVVEQAAFNEKKWVWVEDEEEGYLRGEIINEIESEQKLEVLLHNGAQVKIVDINDTQQMNPPKFDQVEDAAQLTYLNEASVVHNLRIRYFSNKIYTYSGLFLVAVNPFQTLPMYSDAIIALYKNKRRGELPPHIYAAADQAYHDMMRNNENQSILITGESGAGKTESTKRVIQYLTAIASGKEIGHLEKQILQANPILEAFGNAQTIRNKNSSRFGKFIRIEFNLGGTISGAHIEYYLLEKSRVHKQASKERNYHIFYQLLAANKDLKDLLLLDGTLNNYAYIKDSAKVIEGVDDQQELRNTMNAMDVIGFDIDDQMSFFRVVASILHMGNIPVVEGRDCQAEIKDFSAAERACHLLGIPVQEFCSGLLNPRIKAGRDWVSQARTKNQVVSSLEALAKVLYERSFGKIVEKINQAIDAGKGSGNLGFIGVLDIAGFEIFDVNSFEQLCINYTNEKLQQFFNHHMFAAEQEEYSKEGIEWSYIDFGLDLQPTIDLIEKTNPIGVLSCLDEECVMPKASDKTFTEKMESLWAGKSSKYEQVRFKQGFILNHYAANVEYATEGWLDKNKDPLNETVARLLARSSEKYMSSLFLDYSTDEQVSEPSAGSSNKFRSIKARKGAGFLRTVAQRHKEQLNSLVRTLYDTQPHFIRCIVPNPENKPSKFSALLVLDQLRCNGVLEGIRIQRKGYPNRLSFADFRKRYEIICPGKMAPGFIDGHKTAQIILDEAQLDESTYKIGLSKVFFKADIMAHMDEIRDEHLNRAFTGFQARCRTFLRTKFARKRTIQLEMIQKLQKNARIYVALSGWSWWKLYSKVKPLTSITRMDEELQEKKETISELELVVKQKESESQKYTELNRSLEQEKDMLIQQLETERQIAEDNSEILSRAQDKLSQTLEELQDTTTELRNAETELEDAKKAQQANVELVESLKSHIQEKEASITQLKSELLESQQKIHNVSQKLVDNAAKIETLTQQLASSHGNNKEVKSLLEEKEMELNEAKKEMIGQQQELSRLKQVIYDNITASQKKLESVETDYKTTLESFETLEHENQKIRNMLHTQEDEFAKLNNQFDQQALQKDLSDRDMQLLQSRLDMLTEELDIENVKRQQLMDDQVKYHEELSKMRQLMEAKVDEATKQNELQNFREQELDDLKSQNSAYEQELKDVRKKNMEAISKLNEDKQQLRAEIFVHEQEKNELEKSSRNLANQLAEKQEYIELLESVKQKIADELKHKKCEIADLEVAMSKSAEEKTLLEHRLSAEMTKNGDLDISNQKTKESCDMLEKENSQLKEELSGLSNKLEHINGDNESLTSELTELQNKSKASEAEKSKISKQFSVMNSEIERLKAQHRQEVESLRKALQEAMKSNQDDRVQFQLEREKLQSRVSQVEKASSRLTTEAEGARMEADRDRSELKQVQKLLKHGETQVEALKAQLQSEKQEREQAESEARKLRHSVDNLTAEVEENRDVMANLQKRKDVLESELKTFEIEAGKEGKASTATKKQQRQLEQRLIELQEEVEKLADSLRIADDSRKQLEQYGIECRLQMEQEYTSKENVWKETKFLLMTEIDQLTEKYEKEQRVTEQLRASNSKLSSDLEGHANARDEAHNNEQNKALKRLEAQLAEMQQKIETEEKAKLNYQEISSIYENKAMDLQNEIEKQELQLEHVQKSLQEAQKYIIELEQNCMADKETIELLEAKSARLSEKVVKLQEDIDDMEEQHNVDIAQRDLPSGGSVKREIWEELSSKNAKLEEVKRGLQAQLRLVQQKLDDYEREFNSMLKHKESLQLEIEDLREQLEGKTKSLAEELSIRRKLEVEMQKLQVLFNTESAKAIESSEMSNLYKDKAETAMNKYEEVNIAKLRLEKSENTLKSLQEEVTEDLRMEKLYREQAESKLAKMEAQMAEMESSVDDLLIQKESLTNSQTRLAKELKMERERNSKDKAEWVHAEDASRRKYQRELSTATNELEEHRELVKSLQAENRFNSSTIEELNARLEEESLGNITWKREKEKLESRLAELMISLQALQEERDDIQEDLESIMIKSSDSQNALVESENQRIELEQRCHMLQKRLRDSEDQNLSVIQSKQLYERNIQSLGSELYEVKARLDEAHDMEIEAKNKAQKAELLVIEAQNENVRLQELNDELSQQKVSLEKQLQELQKCVLDDSKLGSASSARGVPLGLRIEELKAQLESEAKARLETTRTIRNNERFIEAQKKALTENEEQVSRQQEELLAAEQRVKSLRSELDDLFVSEAKTRSLQRSAEREAKEAQERAARLERELERLKLRNIDRSVSASPSLSMLSSG